MTQPASGFVDIHSRDSGKLLSQSQSHSSQTVRLDPPSLVNIHAPATSIIDYQQQGDDTLPSGTVVARADVLTHHQLQLQTA
ncbi:hypothetical protein ACFL9S_10130 [Erwinia sp. AnSW2-5]|uniref:hypothetical protein n=1 Tax=Erwinia sp. AnSW2-5 TaxID=3367692 RepID=UPI00385C1305